LAFADQDGKTSGWGKTAFFFNKTCVLFQFTLQVFFLLSNHLWQPEKFPHKPKGRKKPNSAGHKPKRHRQQQRIPKIKHSRHNMRRWTTENEKQS
jgi:hypothetical protein